MRRNDPFIVEVTRGALIESLHRVRAVVIDADGKVAASWGAVDEPVYPRSAVKPFQAIPIVITGAANHFGFDPSELALACSSHGGTEAHIKVARAMMAKCGADLTELGCGAHAPMDAAAAHALARSDVAPTALHNNCSGKHLGMIATARHQGEPVGKYLDAEHPVQRRVLDMIERCAGQSLAGFPIGIDGCSAPTFALPLRALGLAFARLGAPDALERAIAAACRRVTAAMLAAPIMVAGPGRLTTGVMEAGAGAIVLKEGAEGVYAAALPHHGLGIALKAEDGAVRASEVALLAILRRFGALPAEVERRLEARFEPLLRNWRGTVIGRIRLDPAALSAGA